MFERFTAKAIKVIMLAQEEARSMGHNFVGTEQILLGLIGEGTGIAARSLKAHGVELKNMRIVIEKRIGRGNGYVPVQIPFTPRAKRLLELSWDEARILGHNYIGTEHLILGFIREGEGIGALVLIETGIDLASLRAEVLEIIQQYLSTSEQTCDIFKSFSAQAIRVMKLAQDESRGLGHNFVGSEHVLLGLIGEHNGVASKALKACGLRPSELRLAVEQQIGRGSGGAPAAPADIPYTTECQGLLELARNQARLLNDYYVSTEHLLLGLLSHNSSTAFQVLLGICADLDGLRAIVLNIAGKLPEPVPTEANYSSSKISNPTLDIMANESISAIVHAQDEASRMGHDLVNSGHLLLGLIAGHHDSAMKALRSRGVYLSDARSELQKLRSVGPRRTVTVNRFSPRVQRILTKTRVQKMGHFGQLVLPDDILLALLDETDGMAIRILSELKCVVSDLRQQLLQIGQGQIAGVAEPLAQKSSPKILTDCFTEPAVRVLRWATEEAQGAGSERIGTEHLVIALYIHGAAKAAQSEIDLGFVLDQLRTQSAKVSPHGRDSSKEDLPFSENIKDVFNRAFKCVQAAGLQEIGPEHLLLGLTGLSDASGWMTPGDKCSGLQTLESLGVQLSELKTSVADSSSLSAGLTPLSESEGSNIISESVSKIETTERNFSGAVSFDNFEADAMAAILLAHEEARRQGRNLVGSEQLLLGLLLEQKGKAGKMLRAIPLDPDFVRQKIEEITGPSEIAEFKTIPYTFRVKTIFGFAQESQCGSQAVATTEKILLALLRDPYCIAHKILRLACVNVDALKGILLAQDFNLPVVEWNVPLKSSIAEEKDPEDHFPLYSKQFSSSLAGVIEFAKSLASSRSDGIAGPEHLHLALAALPNQYCKRLFDELGIDREETRASLTASLTKSTSESSQFFVFTPTARQAVMQACYSARFKGEAIVGPKHLLKAIRQLNE